MNSEPNNVSAPVVYGMDLSEYYLNVEWDILRVPAERRVKKYPCCPEPYPGKIFMSHHGTIITVTLKDFMFFGKVTSQAKASAT